MFDERSPYDDLSIAKVILFFMLILMVNAIILVGVFPYGLDRHFVETMHGELAMMRKVYGDDLYLQLHLGADAIYQTVIVRSGFEQFVYGYYVELQDMTGAETRLAQIFAASELVDNCFDYLLLLSYRLASILILGVVAFFLMANVVSLGLLRRQIQRYSFGDTTVLLNIWSRGLFSYAVPIFVIVVMLPMSLHPAVLMFSLGGLALAASAFIFALPKAT